MDQQRIELYSDYIDGHLSPEARVEFVECIKSDIVLEQEFEEFKSFYAVLKNQFSEERKGFVATLEAVDQQYEYVPPLDFEESYRPKKRKSETWPLTVAAGILLIIGLFMIVPNGVPDYADYFPAEELILIQRGEESNALYRAAETHFNKENYSQAVRDFDAILKIEPGNTEIQYFKAVALMEIEHFEAADNLFKTLQAGSSVFSEKAQYALAISLVKQENYSGAKAVLKSIPESSLEYSKARKLLKAL